MYTANAGPFYGGRGVPGGAELQSFYIARALASAGLRVRHVVADAEISRTAEGVEVVCLPAYYAKRGLPRRIAIVQALRSSKGRVYIARTAGIEAGFAGVYARLTGRRFVFSSSHDAEFLRDRELQRQQGGALQSRTVWAQAWIGMQCANAVVVQSERQAELARGLFRLHPEVIRSFCELGAPRPDLRDVFLWVGGFLGSKNPHALLDLAERVPAAQFVMVARERIGWDELAASVRRRADGLPNIALVAPRPRVELLELYGRAIAVVSTSLAEGFPNVFLEGWARGVPSLSLHLDPDGVIVRHGLGGVAGGSIDELARMTRRYLDVPTAAETAGDAAYLYVRETHSPEVVGAAWVALVERLLRRNGRSLSA